MKKFFPKMNQIITEEFSNLGEQGFATEFTSSCVGIRHYSGTLKIGELAELYREPTNKYDPNAIAVFNKGVQVGHIQRYDAAKFAPMMDKGDFFVAECIGAPDKFNYLLKLYVTVY